MKKLYNSQRNQYEKVKISLLKYSPTFSFLFVKLFHFYCKIKNFSFVDDIGRHKKSTGGSATPRGSTGFDANLNFSCPETYPV